MVPITTTPTPHIAADQCGLATVEGRHSVRDLLGIGRVADVEPVGLGIERIVAIGRSAAEGAGRVLGPRGVHLAPPDAGPLTEEHAAGRESLPIPEPVGDPVGRRDGQGARDPRQSRDALTIDEARGAGLVGSEGQIPAVDADLARAQRRIPSPTSTVGGLGLPPVEDEGLAPSATRAGSRRRGVARVAVELDAARTDRRGRVVALVVGRVGVQPQRVHAVAGAHRALGVGAGHHHGLDHVAVNAHHAVRRVDDRVHRDPPSAAARGQVGVGPRAEGARSVRLDVVGHVAEPQPRPAVDVAGIVAEPDLGVTEDDVDPSLEDEVLPGNSVGRQVQQGSAAIEVEPLHGAQSPRGHMDRLGSGGDRRRQNAGLVAISWNLDEIGHVVGDPQTRCRAHEPPPPASSARIAASARRISA